MCSHATTCAELAGADVAQVKHAVRNNHDMLLKLRGACKVKAGWKGRCSLKLLLWHMLLSCLAWSEPGPSPLVLSSRLAATRCACTGHVSSHKSVFEGAAQPLGL